MLNEVYLLWKDYNTNVVYLIGKLHKDNNYKFVYYDTALKAKEKGCVLPFNGNFVSDVLPDFFKQRIINEEILNKLNIKYNLLDELSMLIINEGKINKDNYFIINEDKLNEYISYTRKK